jgi:hypothetical protein
MRIPALVGGLACATAALVTHSATADERPAEAAAPAKVNAFEIAFGLGVVTPSGDFTARPGDSVRQQAQTGASAEVALGFRFDRHASIALTGAYAHYDVGPGVPASAEGAWYSTHGFGAGLSGTWHFVPDGLLDPWVSFGAGWRAVRLVERRTTAAEQTTATPGVRHGVDVVQARVGLEWRLTSSIALGPFLGADATVFLAERALGGGTTNAIPSEDLALATFFHGGVGGRFDLGGRISTAPRSVASR